MTRRAVILFARTPEAEAVAKGLSRQAIRLFERLIAEWLRAASAAGADAFIACARSERERFATIARDVSRAYIDQHGVTFGARLASAASSVISYDAIVISGIDAPPPPDLARALEALEAEEVDAAIAPARDGGVNLIAFREAPLDLLATVAPGDGTIARRCRDRFPQLYEFARTSDLDTEDDIARATREAAWKQFRHLLAACITAPAHKYSLAHAVTQPDAFAGTRGPPPS